MDNSTSTDNSGENGGENSASNNKLKASRERSTIGFPYDDLNAALKLAQAAHNVYGGDCTADQLAASMGATPTSGAFRLKVSAGRMFGVLGGSGSKIKVMTLGIRALSPEDAGARADAFLNVPLYSKLYEEYSGGKTLPDDTGLEAKIRSLGVSAKQVSTARQVFIRSAEQAGFFVHGRTKLVMPPRGKVAETPPPDENPDGGGRDDDLEVHAIMKHPLIQGLLAVLPEPGEEFPAEDRALWLQTLEMNLSFIYKPKPNRKPAQDHAVETATST